MNISLSFKEFVEYKSINVIDRKFRLQIFPIIWIDILEIKLCKITKIFFSIFLRTLGMKKKRKRLEMI